MSDDTMLSRAGALKIHDVLKNDAALDDVLEIEDALISIKHAERKIELFKEIKKKRAQAIDEYISEQEERVEKLRNAISQCMLKHKEKSIEFPDMAKCTLSKKKGTWTIEDEAALADFLKRKGQFKDVAEEVVKFNKKELNKLLDQYEKANNIPPSVKREDEKDSLSVSFSKQADEKAKQYLEVETAAPSLSQASNVRVIMDPPSTYDTLEL